MSSPLPQAIRGRWLTAAGLLTAVIILAGGLRLYWWPADAGPISVQLVDIASITIQPVPEGPTLIWHHPPTSPPSQQTQQVEAAIPIPLPGPESQMGCTAGADLIVHLTDGRDITYGPCKHPAAIRALWARMIKVLADPTCTVCGPEN